MFLGEGVENARLSRSGLKILNSILESWFIRKTQDTMNTPQAAGTLLTATVEALTTGQHAATGPALLANWLTELAHYDGLEPVRTALGNLQNTLLNQPDPAQIRVLLLELSEYTHAFARQTTGPQAAALTQLASALQAVFGSSEEVGHS